MFKGATATLKCDLLEYSVSSIRTPSPNIFLLLGYLHLLSLHGSQLARCGGHPRGRGLQGEGKYNRLHSRHTHTHTHTHTCTFTHTHTHLLQRSAREEEVQKLTEKNTSLEEEGSRLKKERDDLAGKLSSMEREVS